MCTTCSTKQKLPREHCTSPPEPILKNFAYAELLARRMQDAVSRAQRIDNVGDAIRVCDWGHPLQKNEICFYRSHWYFEFNYSVHYSFFILANCRVRSLRIADDRARYVPLLVKKLAADFFYPVQGSVCMLSPLSLTLFSRESIWFSLESHLTLFSRSAWVVLEIGRSLSVICWYT